MSANPSPVLHFIAYDDFLSSTRALAAQVRGDDERPDYVIGIGRGGLTPAVYISHELQVPMLSIDHSAKVPGFADELLAKVAAMTAQGTRVLFVDDINDSGGTINYLRGFLADNGCDVSHMRFAVLLNNVGSGARVDYAVETIDRSTDKRWFVFPWEAVMSEAELADEARAVPERLG